MRLVQEEAIKTSDSQRKVLAKNNHVTPLPISYWWKSALSKPITTRHLVAKEVGKVVGVGDSDSEICDI